MKRIHVYCGALLLGLVLASPAFSQSRNTDSKTPQLPPSALVSPEMQAFQERIRAINAAISDPEKKSTVRTLVTSFLSDIKTSGLNSASRLTLYTNLLYLPTAELNTEKELVLDVFVDESLTVQNQAEKLSRLMQAASMYKNFGATAKLASLLKSISGTVDASKVDKRNTQMLHQLSRFYAEMGNQTEADAISVQLEKGVVNATDTDEKIRSCLDLIRDYSRSKNYKQALKYVDILQDTLSKEAGTSKK